MGRVIFMSGPAGSGKSTVARRYERQGMTRLSLDREAWSRGITTMPLPPGVQPAPPNGASADDGPWNAWR